MNPLNRANDVAVQGRKDLESDAAWRSVRQEFFATGRAANVQRSLTEAADAAVIGAYQSSLVPVLAGPAAILAVSGFGRGELFPFSDAEIVIVLEGGAPPRLNDALTEFVRLLWEKGVAPSYRFCSVDECLTTREQNADPAIRLLDRRVLAGDARLTARLDEELSSFYAKNGDWLAQRLSAVTRERHAKYNNTPSHREPDVKDTPGGLRDLRLASRLAKLCPERVTSVGILNGTADLLSAIRCFLHYRAHSDNNVLDSAAQAAFVGQFAPGATPATWMREYFRHTRAVFNVARRALDSCEGSRATAAKASLDTQSEFTDVDGRLYLRDTAGSGVDPEMALRCIEFIARHGIAPAAETERRLERAEVGVAAFCAHRQPLWPTLSRILSLPHAAEAVRVLQNTGLLSCVFPEWARIEGVTANESHHRYTLDEHTLQTIERTCDLRETADPALEWLSETFSEIEDLAVLLFALLFHHAGEGSGSTDATRAATALAREAAARVQMPAHEQDLAAFLIGHQATLLEAAGARDLSDPATVRLLAQQAGTIEHLRLLAVLTYADIASTYSEAVVPWRVQQLHETYVAVRRELVRELETDRIHEVPSALSVNPAFLEGFPMRYLAAHTAAEIEAHARLYELSRPTGVAVELEETGGAYKLTIVARDMPALFASFAGAISSFGLDILKAEAFSNAHGIILDTFVFADAKRTLELNPPEAERLQDMIRRVALGKTEARRLLRSRPRPDANKHDIEPQVHFDSEACEAATLVEIVTEDRPGLLYSFASVFASNACDIEIVLIDTKGHRAIDVFYVARNGTKLSPEVQAQLEKPLLLACLGESTA